MENQVFWANARSFMSKMLCSVMIVMAIVCFTSCDSKHPSKLVGKWNRRIYISYEGGKALIVENSAPYDFPQGDIEFLKDGKAVINGNVTTWEVSDYRLFIDNKAYNYDVSGADGLTLKDGDKSADYLKTN
jgi:hypothetical protein